MKRLFFVFVAFVALAAPAAAFLPVIDPSAIVHLIESTVNQTTQIANEFTQIQNQVISIQNEARNLRRVGNIGSAQGVIEQVGGMVRSANAAPPEQQGNVAAQGVIDQTQDAQTRISVIDGQAQSADGAQQQAQVANLYQSTIAGNTAQTNALLAEQQKQRRDEIDGAGNALVTLYGMDRPVDNGL